MVRPSVDRLTPEQVLQLINHFKVHTFPKRGGWVAVICDPQRRTTTWARATGSSFEHAVSVAVAKTLHPRWRDRMKRARERRLHVDT